MSQPNYPALMQQLIAEDLHTRMAARMILLSMQEDAVNPIGDAFYEGVGEGHGVALIEIVAAIGGPDALAMLRNIFEFEKEQHAWRVAAAKGLLHHQHALSDDERDRVAVFLARNARL